MIRPPVEETKVDVGICEPCGMLCPVNSGRVLEVEDTDEAQEARLNPHGVRPTSEEVDKHNATHLTFRSWCPFCVAGRAKNEPHYKSEEHKPMGVNVVSIDYAFMGEKNVVDEADEEASDEESEVANRNSQNMQILLMRRRKPNSCLQE